MACIDPRRLLSRGISTRILLNECLSLKLGSHICIAGDAATLSNESYLKVVWLLLSAQICHLYPFMDASQFSLDNESCVQARHIGHRSRLF